MREHNLQLHQINNFGAVVGWGPLLKLRAWKVGDRGFEPHSGIQASKNPPAHS